MLKGTFKLNINEGRDETQDCGNVDTWETLDVKPEEFRECELSNINQESNCDKEDQVFPEEVKPVKTLRIKRTTGDSSQ